jgi:hypothetical protein
MKNDKLKQFQNFIRKHFGGTTYATLKISTPLSKCCFEIYCKLFGETTSEYEALSNFLEMRKAYVPYSQLNKKKSVCYSFVAKKDASNCPNFQDHGNGNYSYETKEGFVALIVNDKNVLEGKKVKELTYYKDDVCVCKDDKGKIFINRL